MKKKNQLSQKFIILIITLISISNTIVAQSFQFNNGNWLINKKIKSKTVYTINGKFTFKKPSSIDSIIDLKNKYCIPPFGDAHTHNLDGTYGLKEMVKQYLDDGVFYVQVLGNYGSGAEAARKLLTKKIDVTYANGLLTATYGHGFYPYEPMAMGFYSPIKQFKFVDSVKKSRIAENNAYFFLDTTADVDSKWDLIMKYKPDHIKICLLDASDYKEKRKAEKVETYGLSPEVAAYVVKKAHLNGFRVFAHVETADDARLSAKIGVDVLAHLPGYGWNGAQETKDKFCITNADVKLLKKSRIAVIPTMNIDNTTIYDTLGNATPQPSKHEALLQYKKFAIQTLIKNKIIIGLGADYYGKTVKLEIDSLISLAILTNNQLLDLYCRQTPLLIFPNRKIGLIKENYEASFLVLDENPLINIQTIKNIKYRVRQGIFLKL